jgi:hypothetical protein
MQASETKLFHPSHPRPDVRRVNYVCGWMSANPSTCHPIAVVSKLELEVEASRLLLRLFRVEEKPSKQSRTQHNNNQSYGHSGKTFTIAGILQTRMKSMHVTQRRSNSIFKQLANHLEGSEPHLILDVTMIKSTRVI